MSQPLPDKVSAAPAKDAKSLLHTLWVGRGGAIRPIRSVLSIALIGILLTIFYRIALALLRPMMPLKLAGVVVLVLVGVVAFVLARMCLTLVLRLGVKRMLLLITVGYLIAWIITALLVPTGIPGLGHWTRTAGNVALAPIELAVSFGRRLVRLPEDVRFAATGKRPLTQLPGIEWADGVPPTPIPIELVPIAGGVDRPRPTASPAPTAPSTEMADQSLQIGDAVHVEGTDGAPLRARATPSLSGEVVARFPAGSMLKIIDGPHEDEQRVWWRVRGDQGEGWCVADFLVAVRPDQ